MADPFEKRQDARDPFETPPGGGGSIPVRKLVLAVACLSIVGAVVFALKARRPAPALSKLESVQQVENALGAADYERAMELADEERKKHGDRPEVNDLWNALQRDIRPQIELHCAPGGAPPTGSFAAKDCLHLRPGDEFYFTLDLRQAQSGCYAYMFLVDSKADWIVLLPNKLYSRNRNPFPPARYQIPIDVGRRLTPADTAGSEKMFLVIANWRIDVLEDLALKLEGETDPERARAVGRQIQKRLEAENAKPDGLHGLRVGSVEIQDLGKLSASLGAKL
jgi:hypothetical protein